ncbi:MAG: histidine phosphatase family protein [Hellea sp.]|nr:histidine phosphatase family protein [Hellea sp.]
MLNRLLLMRHAKSSWAEEGLSDHERPLNKRGKRAAIAMGQALTARGFAPDQIWSSDSKRTRETAMHLIREIPGAQGIEFIPEFYHASARNVLEVCAQRGEPEKPTMLLGHNPGWGELHHHFTGQYHNYPTGACTVLERAGDGPWLSPDNWTFKDLILPRELE